MPGKWIAPGTYVRLPETVGVLSAHESLDRIDIFAEIAERVRADIDLGEDYGAVSPHEVPPSLVIQESNDVYVYFTGPLNAAVVEEIKKIGGDVLDVVYPPK